MRLSISSFLALSLCHLVGCTAASEAGDGIAAGESNYTGADAASDAGSEAAATAPAVADVAPFKIADANPTPKLRFSYDGAPAVDAYQPEGTTLASGVDRRFRIQGATPIAGGKPVFYVEFGRGTALVEKGTYDCARMEALVLVIENDGAKKLTVVNGAAQRACKVVIDEAVDFVPTVGQRPRSWRDIIGHVEATVGDRTNAASDTKSVRAAFAYSVIEY